MNTLNIFILLLLLFGFGGFFFVGPIIGGASLSLILLVALMVYLTDGFQQGA